MKPWYKQIRVASRKVASYERAHRPSLYISRLVLESYFFLPEQHCQWCLFL